jgi:hypothetical protein
MSVPVMFLGAQAAGRAMQHVGKEPSVRESERNERESNHDHFPNQKRDEEDAATLPAGLQPRTSQLQCPAGGMISFPLAP